MIRRVAVLVGLRGGDFWLLARSILPAHTLFTVQGALALMPAGSAIIIPGYTIAHSIAM